MRANSILFVIGLVMIAVGVVLIVFPPVTVSLEPESYVIANHEVLNVTENSSVYFHPVVLPNMGEAEGFMVEGIAAEVGEYKFNFYVFNKTNYDLFKAGDSFTAYFETYTDFAQFSFSLMKKEEASDLYFTVEDPRVVSITVNISATLEWNEKTTIAMTVAGLSLGGFIGIIGFVPIIIAGIASLVKPKTRPSSTITQETIHKDGARAR